MREAIYFLGAAGVGAALMYLLDPDGGNRRRALIRDKMVKLNRQTQKAVSSRVKDMSNRAKGMLHETKSGLESDHPLTEQPTTFS